MKTRLIVLLATVPLLAACGIEASLNELNPAPSVLMREGFTNVAVTSMQDGESAEDQYKAQVSSGALTDRIASRTANGTLVLTSTQGAMLDDVTVKNLQLDNTLPAQQ